MAKKITDQYRAPKEVRNIRIGQLYDAVNGCFLDEVCLDMNKLFSNKMLQLNNFEVEEDFVYKHANEKDSEVSSLKIGASGATSGWGMEIKGSYSYAKDKAIANNSNKISASITKFKKAEIRIMNYKTVNRFWDSMIEFKGQFYKDYLKIKNENNANIKQIRILDFKKKYGTGCVTSLKLVGGVIGHIEFTSNAQDSKTKSSHDASLSFESKFASVQGALSIAESASNSRLNIDEEVHVVCFPNEDENYKQWMNGYIDFVREKIKGVDTKANLPDFIDTKINLNPENIKLKGSKDDTKLSTSAGYEAEVKKLQSLIFSKNNDDILQCIDLLFRLCNNDQLDTNLKKAVSSNKKMFPKLLLNKIESIDKKVNHDINAADIDALLKDADANNADNEENLRRVVQDLPNHDFLIELKENEALFEAIYTEDEFNKNIKPIFEKVNQFQLN